LELILSSVAFPTESTHFSAPSGMNFHLQCLILQLILSTGTIEQCTLENKDTKTALRSNFQNGSVFPDTTEVLQ
jgi:hypothetical protein